MTMKTGKPFCDLFTCYDYYSFTPKSLFYFSLTVLDIHIFSKDKHFIILAPVPVFCSGTAGYSHHGRINKNKMIDFDAIWRFQDEVRTVVNACLGDCIWNLNYNPIRQCIELELKVILMTRNKNYCRASSPFLPTTTARVSTGLCS